MSHRLASSATMPPASWRPSSRNAFSASSLAARFAARACARCAGTALSGRAVRGRSRQRDPDIRRKMFQVRRVSGQARDPVDDIAELADVSRIGMVRKEVPQSARHLDRSPFQRFGGLVAEILEQQRYLVLAFAQGW